MLESILQALFAFVLVLSGVLNQLQTDLHIPQSQFLKNLKNYFLLPNSAMLDTTLNKFQPEAVTFLDWQEKKYN